MGRNSNRTRLDPVEQEARALVKRMRWDWDAVGQAIKDMAMFVAVEHVTMKEQLDRLNEELSHPLSVRADDEEQKVLFTMTLGGNMFAATDAIGGRLRDLVPHLLQMSCQSPYNHTIAVFRAPLSLIRRLQEERKI